jgi:hypothetical protein
MMQRILLLSLFVSMIVRAQSDVLLYGGLLDYTGTTKKSGWFSGAYLGQAWSDEYFELAYEHLSIDYVDDNITRLEQNDITAVWTHHLGSHYLTRAGVHYVDSSDDPSDGGYSLFAGVKYYEGYSYDLGVDVYYTYFDSFLSDDQNASGLQVIQVEPSIGFAHGDHYSAIGSFYTKLYYDHIRPSNEGYSQLDDSYHSVGVTLRNFNGRWTTTLDGWLGKQVFAMQKAGFVMYNLAEEHSGGIEVSVHYVFSDVGGIKVQYGYNRFKEFDIGSASSSAISTFLDYRF